MTGRAQRHRRRITRQWKAEGRPLGCHWCGKPFDQNDARWQITLEHIKPLRDGGTWEPGNLTLAHEASNRKREREAARLRRPADGIPRGGRGGLKWLKHGRTRAKRHARSDPATWRPVAKALEREIRRRRWRHLRRMRRPRTALPMADLAGPC